MSRSRAMDVVPVDADEASRVSTPDSVKGFAPDTAIIFDWDDTLLCSTWLQQRGLRLDSPRSAFHSEVCTALKGLEDRVVCLLERALCLGPVYVITNAETGWVELSAEKFIPGVIPVLKKARVLSARSTFESLCPCPTEWKYYAFSQEMDNHFAGFHPEASKTVVSFGDSIHERIAIQRVTSEMASTRTKSIKFVERPSIEQLRRQVELVSSCFDDILQHPGDLDLMLTIHHLESSETEEEEDVAPSPSSSSSSSKSSSSAAAAAAASF